MCASLVAACSATGHRITASPAVPSPPRVAPRCTISMDEVGVVPGFSPPVVMDDGPAPSAANALAWVRALAAPEVHGRRSGSDDERAVARALADGLTRSGWHPVRDDGELCQGFSAPMGADQNVVAALGDAPDAPTVLVGAHYDALGTTPGGAVYPGADDDASGVAALLELARTLPRRTRRANVVLVFFGGEEAGLYGSRFFVAHPWVSLDHVRVMINLDMVGRQFLEGQSVRWLLGNPRDALGYILGNGTPEVAALLHGSARAVGVPLLGITESLFRASGYGADSVAFSPFMPTVFLSSSMHDDYHRVTDTADRVDPAQIARAASIVTAMIEALAPE